MPEPDFWRDASLDMQVKRAGSSLVIHLKGELDLHTAEAFRQTADDEMADNTVKNLVLVLSDVSFIDSSGVGAILGRYRTVHKRGGRMVAVGLRPMAKRVLELSGVLSVIHTAETERRALARL